MISEKHGGLSIDSFKMRIPISEIEIIDDQLNTNLLHVLQSTGEIISTVKIKERSGDRSGVAFKYWLERLQHGNKGMVSSFLLIAVHSKMLGAKYLNGITENDLPSLYEYLMSYKVANFSYESFISARVTDVDVKQDFIATGKTVETVMDQLTKNYVKRDTLNSGFKKHKPKGKKYTGHQFNTRKTPSFHASPYMKVYDKYEDSMSAKHRQFFLETAGVTIPENLWRSEFTLKGSKHMRMFEIENTVQGIITADVVKLRSAQRQVMSALFNRAKRMRIESDNTLPRDLVDMALLRLVLENTGMAAQEVIDIITADISKDNRSKYRERFLRLLLSDQELTAQDQDRETLYNILGYDMNQNGQNGQ